jgi:hypothetical protein
MGPQGRDPMMPGGLGQQFRPVQSFQPRDVSLPPQAQGVPFQGMPAQAQGNAYGVPFVPLGAPQNPASQPAAPARPVQAASGIPPYPRRGDFVQQALWQGRYGRG